MFPSPVYVRAFDGKSSFIHFHIPPVQPNKVPKVVLNITKNNLLLSYHNDFISFHPTNIASGRNSLSD